MNEIDEQLKRRIRQRYAQELRKCGVTDVEFVHGRFWGRIGDWCRRWPAHCLQHPIKTAIRAGEILLLCSLLPSIPANFRSYYPQPYAAAVAVLRQWQTPLPPPAPPPTPAPTAAEGPGLLAAASAGSHPLPPRSGRPDVDDDAVRRRRRDVGESTVIATAAC